MHCVFPEEWPLLSEDALLLILRFVFVGGIESLD